VIQGDATSLSIAAASVLAKVYRDRLLVELDREFPGYGLARHKGYATDAHCEAIRRLGPCREHRELFLRKIRSGEVVSEQGEMGI
jgi:ribonuclease HII